MIPVINPYAFGVCLPVDYPTFPWATLFPDQNTDPNYYLIYNDPAATGVSLNLNLGGYALSWNHNDGTVRTTLIDDRGGQYLVDGGAYDSGTDNIYSGYNTTFEVSNATAKVAYGAIGGDNAGFSNPAPGAHEYKAVASFDAWLRSYFKARVYGKPVICELWYSLNTTRANKAKGYNNYSFFGDWGSSSLPYIDVTFNNGHVKKYRAGIFKVGADLNNPTNADCIAACIYDGNASGGTAKVIINGAVVSGPTTITEKVLYIYGDGDFNTNFDKDFMGTGKSYCQQINFTLGLPIAGPVNYMFTSTTPDINANSNGLLDTKHVKYGWMVDMDSGLTEGTYDPDAGLEWYPGSFYTLPDPPLPCDPGVPLPGTSYTPAAPI